ncbi:MAG: hypothetical protein NCW75_12010 [Phycisphaera sp.]|nr:MAG: hypothetical protein NCW75_12010 [Phycisphaera sp.]
MNGLVPIWVSAPLAMITLVTVAAHLLAMRGADMPESRRRIRTANGWLILITAPVLVVAFSVVSPQNTRQFALIWAVAMVLVGFVILMAFIDIANNLRIARLQRRRLSRSMGTRLRQQLLAERKDHDAR